MFRLFTKNTVGSIDVNELDELLGRINLIDIREPYEYKAGHLPNSKNIPMNLILSDPEEYLEESKEYHIICHSGSRSSRACSLLKERGFNVVNVSGGTGRYRGILTK
jgi:rhodanese-related sulfurtransferase